MVQEINMPRGYPINGINTGQFKKGMKVRLGTFHTEETKAKMRANHKGMTGKRQSLKHRIATSGSNQWNWKGGITPVNTKIRNSLQYKLWRKSVFERDNYRCVIGGLMHGSKLQADHIKSFAEFPKLRFDINNGRTLCIDCHKKTDSYLVHKGKTFTLGIANHLAR